mgnify:FL=1
MLQQLQLQHLTASGGTWSIPSGSTYARFSATYTIPSGAQTLRVGGVTAVTVGNSVYLAGVQLEEGSAATTFRRNANSIQGELAACQRYYVRLRGSGGTAFTGIPAHGGALSGTTMLGMINVPVTMRVDPTAVEAYALRLVNLQDNVSLAVTDVALSSSWANGYAPYAVFTCSGGGLSANSYYRVGANNNGGSYLGLSAEL